jgi:fibronectin type 3 domain-containing protein
MPLLKEERGPSEHPLHTIHRGAAQQQTDPVVQSSVGPAVSVSGGLSFAGVGQGDYGFSDNAAPPDPNLAVGATQIVQWVNESFAVFNKSTGALVKGPIAGNSLWSALPSTSGCHANNDGDPIVQYDKAAGRWVMTQFSVSSPSTYHYLQCVAVSQTSDATGAFNLYVFDYGTVQFPDYPKLGVWPDAYYVSYNIFNNGSTWAGAKLCAFDRNAMLQGAPTANQQCFQLGTNDGGLLPADVDGSTPPPAGSPGLYLEFDGNNASLDLWQFHVDWANSAYSSLTSINVPVAGFNPACNGGGTCIPQPGTTQQLDSLADRLMYRLAYRNFGAYEALVANQSVTSPGGQVGIRWYELHNPTGSTFGQATSTNLPVVYQQATYAPDSSYRWMGSIAMDRLGDIALGYSLSSSSIYPSIEITGHNAATDALNTMEAETQIKAGGGSQHYFGGLSRWGDYTAMSVDPSDDCTFWYTDEYLKSSGGFNWSTWISSFRFPACTAVPPAAPTSLAASAVSSKQISLTWTDNSSNESGFNIERSPDGSTGWAQVGQVGANVTSYTDSSLSPSTTYYYRVDAYNGGGSSGYTNIASATTQAPPPPPAAPTSLNATAVSSSQINLSWTDNATNETGYYVERSTDGTNFTQIASLGVNATSYSSTGLSASTLYYYQVRAYNDGGPSGYSNVASTTTLATPPPAAPTNLTASAIPHGRVNLTWTDNATNETGYFVERSTNASSGFSQIATLGANSTSYQDSSLTAGTTYYYRVRDANSGQYSGYSNTASATARK